MQVLSSLTLVNEVTISYICTNENPADSLSRGHGNKTREELRQLTSGAGPLREVEGFAFLQYYCSK